MLGVILVHAVLMSVFVFDLVERQRSFLRQQSLSQARSLTATLATNSTSWVLASDLAGMEEVIQSLASYPSLRYAMILSPEGRVLAHTDRRLVGLFVKDPVSRQLLQAGAGAQTLTTSRFLTDVAAPILAEQHLIAWARIGLGQQENEANLRLLTWSGLFYALLAIAIGALFAFFLARSLTGGLQRLVNVTTQMRQGRRDVRALLDRQDELGKLGESVNQMLDTLLENEEQVRLLLDSTAEGILGMDLEGRCTLANQASLRMLGYARIAQLVGKPLHQLIHHSRLDGTPLPLDACASHHLLQAKEGVHSDEEHYWRADGSSFPVETWTYPLLHRGELAGIVVTFIDITERRHWMRRLRQANEELEERVKQRTVELEASNKELEAFAYSVSHDLRAPLRAIDGFSRALDEDYQSVLDEVARSYLQRIRAGCARMAQLIDDLLQLSRLTRSEMHIEPVNLSKMANEIIADLRQAEPGRQVEAVVEPDLVAKGDLRLSRIVLENLLSNAWKYTSKHPTAHIAFGSCVRDGQTFYFVRDDGAGFDMSFAGKLFQPFQRMHADKEFPGYGIGLANVQRIVRRHGGQVWAEAAVEQGATFYFSLS